MVVARWSAMKTDPNTLSGVRIDKSKLQTDISNNIDWLHHKGRVVEKTPPIALNISDVSDTTICQFYFLCSGGYVLIEGIIDLSFLNQARDITVKLYKDSKGTAAAQVVATYLMQTGATAGLHYDIPFYYLDDDTDGSGGVLNYYITVQSSLNNPVVGDFHIMATEIGRGVTRYG